MGMDSSERKYREGVEVTVADVIHIVTLVGRVAKVRARNDWLRMSLVRNMSSYACIILVVCDQFTNYRIRSNPRFSR